MRVHEEFAGALLAHGVDAVFGLMGDSNMLYLSSYMDKGGRFVRTVHEGSAVGMADAWSRATGRIGVASVTHGPAFTNTVTSLVEAVRARSAVLLITGDTPPEPTHFQRLDISAVAQSVGAGYEKVFGPQSMVRDLNRALRRVVAERRPIVLDLPISMVRKDAGEQPDITAVAAPGRVAPDTDAVEAALALLAGAKHPIVLAGQGAMAAGARHALVELGDLLAAPLATTALSKELFAGHPSNIGILGNLSHQVAGKAIAEADCIVAFGASLNNYTAFNGELTKGKKIVQVDADPAAFGWYTPVDQAVAGDARLVAEHMVHLLREIDHRPTTGWVRSIQQELSEHDPRDDYRDRTSRDTVDVRTAMIHLDELLPPQRQLVSDIGRFVVGVWPHVKVAEGGHFIAMGAFGSIGLGLAGAIGASVARPDELTVLAVGDGGFAMSVAELVTAVRERLPILVVVLNDGAYGAEHYKLAHFGANADYSLNAWPDLDAVARSMGADGITVRSLADLEPLRERAESLTGPILVDIRLDPEVNVLAG